LIGSQNNGVRKMRAIEDKKWSTDLKKQTDEYLQINPEYKPLVDKLLNIGGDFVIIWRYEPDLDKLISRGKLFKNKIILKQMDFSHCHENAAKLWFKNKNLKIVTGWALSDDGLWRQHSWILKNNTIIETTEIREKYFGVILTEEEDEHFYVSNQG
jgi:hypothetical protein